MIRSGDPTMVCVLQDRQLLRSLASLGPDPNPAWPPISNHTRSAHTSHTRTGNGFELANERLAVCVPTVQCSQGPASARRRP